MRQSMRLFIAIDLPEKAKNIITNVSHGIFSNISGKAIRPVKSSAMHLTLKFLGDVDDAKVENLITKLRESIEKRTSFILIASGIGAFPNTSKPRVVWLGLEGEIKKLHDLQKDIEVALAEIGFPKEKKRYHPHLTLARINCDASTLDIKRIGQNMSKGKVNDLFGWRVRDFVLYRSDLKPSGPVYQLLAKFKLE